MALWSRDPADAGPVRHRAVVGAARRVNLGRRSEVEKLRIRATAPAQQIAWRHYNSIGEVKFAFRYLANTLSRARIYAAYTPDDRDGAPVPIGSVGGLDRDLVTSARYEIAKLDTAHGGQPGLLRQYALNQLVAGECYLVEVGDQMGIYSTSELRVQGTNDVRLVTRRDMRMNEWIRLDANSFVARMWQPHPEYSDEPDSSLIGVREAAEELLMLGRMIRSSAMSQINAGILYVAEELTFEKAEDVGSAPDPDDPDAPEQDTGDVFEEEFTTFMTEPIEDETSSAQVNPLLVRGPAEMSESAIRKIDLSRPFDEVAVRLRETALDRVLNGIDVPKDLITGLANVRFSNAQTISENLYKSHVEPAAVDFCEAIAVARLRPRLLARGFPPDKVARVTAWYDASEVTTAANRSKDADSGHDRILISDQTWRRDHGYSESDAPDEEETARRLAQKSTLAPETAIQLLAGLMPLIGEMAKMHQVVLQPSSMQPQRPPHIPAVDQAALPPGPGTGTPMARVAPPRGSNGVSPASGDEPQPPPEGTPAPSQPFAASGAPDPSGAAESDARRLLDIERALRVSLQTMLTDMTDQAMEKAGSRLVSKLRGDPAAVATIKGVPKTLVAAALGPDAVAAAGFTDTQLINDSVNDAEPKYKQYLRRAHAQAARVLGLPSFGNEDDINHSWAILKPLMVAFMTRALFRKDRSEYVPKLPMDSLRTALARAGGAPPLPGTHNGPQPGAVLNDASIGLLAEKHDAEADGYRWIYGISDNHFEPHLLLDGKTFADWNDPVLRNSGAFPKTSHFYPNDHVGCECDFMPSYVVRQPHEGRVVEHVGGIG